jgi:DNA-binding NtrC family response regulator
MRRLLLLDDEPNVLQALQRALRQCFPAGDLTVETFTDPERALLRCGETSFDVVVSDYRMPGINGIDFLRMVKGIQPDAIRVVLSASTEFDTVMQAINQAEVFRYIPKPWQSDELVNTINLAFTRHDEVAEERRLAEEQRQKLTDMTPQELEARRLEAEEPGITKVNWGPDGSVRLD